MFLFDWVYCFYHSDWILIEVGTCNLYLPHFNGLFLFLYFASQRFLLWQIRVHEMELWLCKNIKTQGLKMLNKIFITMCFRYWFVTTCFLQNMYKFII